MSTFLLLTGMPGVGKTTMIRKVVENLEKPHSTSKLQGFYTEEVRNSCGERIGFDVVSLDGKRGPLARVSTEITNTNRPVLGCSQKVGKYVVYVREFENLVASLIETIRSDENSLLVVDEIGKMELCSEKFTNFICNLRESQKNLKVLATVPLKAQAAIIDQLKSHPKAKLFHMTKSNRDSIFDDLLESTKELMN